MSGFTIIYIIKKHYTAYEYLKSRNLSKDTISKFKLGYSFNNKSTLYEYLKAKSFKEEEIIKSNVIKIDKKNKTKDYFYKRLIFPIMDERGNVARFWRKGA